MGQMHKGHRKRVRKRMRLEDIDSFAPHEIVEYLLFRTISQGDVNETAHELIQRFGSLSGVLDAVPEELCKVKGVGEASADFLASVPQIARAYLVDRYAPEGLLDSTVKLGQYFIYRFVGRRNETMMLLCLDNRLKPLNCEIIGEGSLQQVDVQPRRLVDAAVRNNATALVLAHNHPNGLAIPSPQDVSMTKELCITLAKLGIHLLDHIIVSGEDYCSLAHAGHLPMRAQD